MVVDPKCLKSTVNYGEVEIEADKIDKVKLGKIAFELQIDLVTLQKRQNLIMESNVIHVFDHIIPKIDD